MAVRSVRQREIVDLNFYFPTENTFKPHPAVVVSSDDLHEAEEGMFYAILISTKNLHPDYTIEIREEDLTGEGLDKESYFVSHILGCFNLSQVFKSLKTYVKPGKFNEVVEASINNIFGPAVEEEDN